MNPRLRAFLYQLQAVLLLPFVVIVLVPALIVSNTGMGLSVPTATLNDLLIDLVGLVLFAFGLVLFIKTVSLFITVGKGTLAPWTPTQHLVVSGPYRYMRHPMIGGVFLILFGEYALVRIDSLLWWAVLFLMINLIYIPFFEEPGLEKRFGNEYAIYKRNVPAWFPRRTPWNLK